MSAFRRAISYPANIAVCAAVLGFALVVLADLVDPRVNHASVLYGKFSSFFDIIYVAALMLASATTIFLVISRKWNSASYFFTAAFILLAAMLASEALYPNPYQFADRAHREIAEIYQQKRAEFDRITPVPRFVDLDQQCHPPGGGAGGCGCWLLLDPGHVTGAEKEKAGWHRPNVPIFFRKDLPIQLLNIQTAGSDAFSVLGCDYDWRNWLQRALGN